LKQEGERAIEAIDSFRRIYSELDIRFLQILWRRLPEVP